MTLNEPFPTLRPAGVCDDFPELSICGSLGYVFPGFEWIMSLCNYSQYYMSKHHVAVIPTDSDILLWLCVLLVLLCLPQPSIIYPGSHRKTGLARNARSRRATGEFTRRSTKEPHALTFFLYVCLLIFFRGSAALRNNIFKAINLIFLVYKKKKESS